MGITPRFMNTIFHESREITRKQMAELIDAATYAWRSDKPLSRSLTFNLKGLGGRRPQRFISTFTKLAGDWLATQDIERVYLWVLEWPPGQSLNCHLLVHVPAEVMAGFAKKERSWLRQAGLKWKPNVLLSQKIGIRRGKKDRKLTIGEYLTHLENALGYMLKGGNPKACNRLVIDHRFQGIIEGKRVGVAEAIGRKARTASGYTPPSSMRFALVFSHRHKL